MALSYEESIETPDYIRRASKFGELIRNLHEEFPSCIIIVESTLSKIERTKIPPWLESKLQSQGADRLERFQQFIQRQSDRADRESANRVGYTITVGPYTEDVAGFDAMEQCTLRLVFLAIDAGADTFDVYDEPEILPAPYGRIPGEDDTREDSSMVTFGIGFRAS